MRKRNIIHKRKIAKRKGSGRIRQDFEELYAGADIGKLMAEYYREKRRLLWCIALVGGLLLLLLLYQELEKSRLTSGNTVERQGYGEGSKETILEVKQPEGMWEELPIEIGEREYTEEEIQEIFSEITGELPSQILGENPSLEEVGKELDLSTEWGELPVLLSWRSSNSAYLRSDGSLGEAEVPTLGEVVTLTVTMEYQAYQQEFSFAVRRVPPVLEEKEVFFSALQKELERLEKATREEEGIRLPESFLNTALTWRKKPGTSPLFMLLLLLLVLPLISMEKDRQLHRKAAERKQLLLKQYPDFISRLLLLMDAGMNTKGAIYRLAMRYRRNREAGGKKEYLYEELLYICARMSNGMGEGQAYEMLGARCGLPVYRKLATLLVQNLNRGSGEMLESMRAEADRALDERKVQVRKLGEEAGTKLLFPMMIMLGIVMVLILIPACFSFQI